MRDLDPEAIFGYVLQKLENGIEVTGQADLQPLFRLCGMLLRMCGKTAKNRFPAVCSAEFQLWFVVTVMLQVTTLPTSKQTQNRST